MSVTHPAADVHSSPRFLVNGLRTLELQASSTNAVGRGVCVRAISKPHQTPMFSPVRPSGPSAIRSSARAQTAVAGLAWAPLFLSFHWPSVVYALDILAWDVFFPLAVLFAAPVFGGSRLATSIRVLLLASGALALGGLSGVILGDMRLRNIGVVGYCGVFPAAALLLAILFHRARPR